MEYKTLIWFKYSLILSTKLFSFKWNINLFETTIHSSLSFIFYLTCWLNILNRNRISASISFASSELKLFCWNEFLNFIIQLNSSHFYWKDLKRKKDEKTSFFTREPRMQNIKFWYFLNLFNFPFIVCFIEKMDIFDSIEKHILKNGQPLPGLFQLLFPERYVLKCYI